MADKTLQETLELLHRCINSYVEDWSRPDEWTLKEWLALAEKAKNLANAENNCTS